jgi:hypothetical protein
MKADDYLHELCYTLADAPRTGADKDEPEGMRRVTFSDTFVGQMAHNLERIGLALRGMGIEIELGKATAAEETAADLREQLRAADHALRVVGKARDQLAAERDRWEATARRLAAEAGASNVDYLEPD